MELTVHDVLTFHRLDRAAYDHLLYLGAGRQSARDAVALLLWLYRTACTGDAAASRLLAAIHTNADAAVLVSEAHAALGGPAVAAAAAPPRLLTFLFGEHADRVRGILAATPVYVLRRGVDDVIAGVGRFLFDDQLEGLMRAYQAAGGGGPLPPQLAAVYLSYSPSGESKEQYDARSLFLAFSEEGEQTLTDKEIMEHLIATWGRGCVERVIMKKTPTGEPPSSWRILFYSADAVTTILGEQPLVKLVINGRQLCARNYVPQPPPQH